MSTRERKTAIHITSHQGPLHGTNTVCPTKYRLKSDFQIVMKNLERYLDMVPGLALPCAHNLGLHRLHFTLLFIFKAGK